MAELFKTILILSLLGFFLITLLLCLKPMTAKKFPARWQYWAWIIVMLSMLIPAYKWIPEIKTITPPTPTQTAGGGPEEITALQTNDIVAVPKTPLMYQPVSLRRGVEIRLFDLLSYIWAGGFCILFLVVIISYMNYLYRNQKKSVTITENAVLEDIKKELRIKRSFTIRMSADIQSPMLVGLLRPVIYLPCKEIPDEQLAMVFRHELMHYKRGDLAIKWLALFVNAIHWFNPLAYLLCTNIAESCEVSCDMAVTRTMNDEEQKLYMQTILNLLE